MKSSKFTIGIDIASASFVAAIFCVKDQQILHTASFSNDLDGINTFVEVLGRFAIEAEETLICLEATGVYTEELCYELHHKGWNLVVEAPQKVKRAFYKNQKSDPVDAGQIAEYAWRFTDQLSLWKPSLQIVEELRAILSTREQLLSYRTAEKNSLKALKRKVVISVVAQQAHQQTLAHLTQQIELLEQEIHRLIKEDLQSAQQSKRLQKIPGVGLLMIANLLVHTNGYTHRVEARNFTAFLGISPYEHTSGSSVRRRPRSANYGPYRMRKLLYLAAMNRKHYDQSTTAYYQRKIAEGKAPRLVLNNIANKLIRLICAMITTKREYDPLFVPNRAK